MSDLHLDAAITRYFLQKNAYFVEHYFVEGDIDIDGALISYNDFFYWTWGFDVHPGMGQSIGNVVFDPIDINYGVLPVLEFRLKTLGLVLQNGIDHRCFHEVDRHNFDAIYYNKVFLAAGSRNYRLGHLWKDLVPESGWTYWNRVQWYARWGYFVRELFGWVKPVMLNDTRDNVDNVQEVSVDVRYAAVRLRPLLIVARGTTLVGQAKVRLNGSERDEAYWRQEIALEVVPRTSAFGGLIFAKYIWDDMPEVVTRSSPTESDIAPRSLQPRLSKDRLLQLGVQYFF